MLGKLIIVIREYLRVEVMKIVHKDYCTLATRNGKMKLQFFIVAGNSAFLMAVCEDSLFSFSLSYSSRMERYILVNWRRVIYCERRTFVVTIADYTVPVACILLEWKCQKRLTLQANKFYIYYIRIYTYIQWKQIICPKKERK